VSSLTLELLRDPELLRIAERAHADVHANALAEGRVYTCEEVADRIVWYGDWRRRALSAEAQLRAERSSSPDTREDRK
jgi:hypothetical protein